MDRSQLIDLANRIIDGKDISDYEEHFLPGHLTRLSRRLAGHSKRGIKHYKVNEFDVFIETTSMRAYMDDLMTALNNLKVVFDEVENLSRNLGFGEWVTDYSNTIKNTLSHELRYVNINLGAFIIGKDKETGKFFAHILPLPMSLLLYKCRKKLTDDIIKAVMGFDYQYWEYQGGPGRVRIHGDLVVDVLHSYDGYSPCQALTKFYRNEIHSTISSMRRDLIYQRLNYRILSEIEEDHVIIRKNKNFTEYLTAVLAFASNYVIKDFLGKRHPDLSLEIRLTPSYEFVDGKISFIKLTAYISKTDEYYPHHTTRLDNIIKSLNEAKEKGEDRRDSSITFFNRAGGVIDLKNVNTIIGSYVKGSLYSRIMQEYSQHELYIPFENVIIAIDIDDIVDFLDYYISSRLGDIVQAKLGWEICSEHPERKHWGSTIFDGVINSTADLARYVLGLSKVSIDRHKIMVSAIDLTHSLTAKALSVKEEYESMIAIKKYMVSKKRPSTPPFCTRKVIDAITRFFGSKRGEVYALVEKEIRLEHPEHGLKTFKIKHPTIVKFTLLNSMH